MEDAPISESQVADAIMDEVVEDEGATVHRESAVCRVLFGHLFEECLRMHIIM